MPTGKYFGSKHASYILSAFWFEIEFQGPDDVQGIEVTTEAQILPVASPFEDCMGEACNGSLV